MILLTGWTWSECSIGNATDPKFIIANKQKLTIDAWSFNFTIGELGELNSIAQWPIGDAKPSL
jgi:hypothetical protein